MKTSNPAGFALTSGAATVLFECAGVITDPAARHMYPQCVQRARAALTDLLAAARAGGYPHSQILETLLCNGEVSWRTVEMANRAMDAAGRTRTDRVCEHHGM